MKTTMRTVAMTLTRFAGREHVARVGGGDANLNNLLSSGGGTLKLADVIYPRTTRCSGSMNATTGVSDVIVRWTDTSPADTSTLIERANSAGMWATIATIAQPLDGPRSFTDHGLPTATVVTGCAHPRARTAPR